MMCVKQTHTMKIECSRDLYLNQAVLLGVIGEGNSSDLGKEPRGNVYKNFALAIIKDYRIVS